MKYKNIILLIVSYTFFCTKAIGQDITLTLEVFNSELYNIEPLFYEVQVQNNSEIVQESDIFFGYCQTLEIYNATSKTWGLLKESEKTNNSRFNPMANFGFHSGLATRKYWIQPQQKFVNQFAYFPFEGDFYNSVNYFFKENDTIKIRVACRFNNNSDDIKYSNEIEIVVLKNDTEVSQYLEKKHVPHFIFEPVLFHNFQGHFFPKEASIYPDEAKYIIANYPNSKFAAWADLHLAWNESLAADKNIIEAQYGLAQDSTLALNNAKEQLINAKTYLESALEGNNPLVRPYVKQLYYTIVENKFRLGLYVDLEEYFKALEYVDSL
jgi:hypothetical protein